MLKLDSLVVCLYLLYYHFDMGFEVKFTSFSGTFRGSESSIGGSSFVVAADDAGGAAGFGSAEKSLHSKSKAVVSSIVFYRAEEDRKANSVCMLYPCIASSSLYCVRDSPPWVLRQLWPLLLPFS